MRISHWLDGSLPVYLNPTWDETRELKESNPDTVRLLEGQDGNLAVASGYGHTHATIVQTAFMKFGKRWHANPGVLFKRNRRWYIEVEFLHDMIEMEASKAISSKTLNESTRQWLIDFLDNE